MALNIKHPEADSLARALARTTGETITEAIINALRERLRRESGAQSIAALRDEMRRIQRHYLSLPVQDSRSPDEILGYDEDGLPG